MKIIEDLRYTDFVVNLRKLIPNWLVNNTFHISKAILANILYGFPSRKLKVIAITGTKGKTSTAHLLYHILVENNYKTALISTIYAKFGAKEISTGLHVTDPGPIALQKILKFAVTKKYEFVILEVTSHGLDQFRNWSIRFELGIYTQVSEDHLGYHGGVEGYKKAKAKMIIQSKKVILNRDDPSSRYLKSIAEKHFIPTIEYQGERDNFQSQNISAALKAAEELGISTKDAKQALISFPGVPGRMEVIQEAPFAVVIDFAHTPESLEAALKILRKKIKKERKLIIVFGCAGERDPNRRRMGAVAAKLSDLFIITAEDPRTEGVKKISQEIAEYAEKEGATELSISKASKAAVSKTLNKTYFYRIADRQQAINKAILVAKSGDVVGLFGKGHEQSMCFGKTERPWSEHLAVKKALKKKEKITK
jgi:UDP-N-acetylmuramoyl-L-alanyl-D-glutamate--2,6-diaminopimelate ligase